MWSRTLKKVEKVLGFKLYDWQKDYIMLKSDWMPSERASGRTTAFILRHLLNYGGQMDHFVTDQLHHYPLQIGWDWWQFPDSLHEPENLIVYSWYAREILEMAIMLYWAGIETRIKIIEKEKNDGK